MVRMFANGSGELGLVLGRDIPKTQKMILVASLLNTQHYKVRIKGKWSNPGKEVAPSQTPRLMKGGPSGHSRLRSAKLYIYIERERI